MADKFAYVARTQEPTLFDESGKIICVVVDDPNRRDDVALSIADWIREGLAVERVPIEWARSNFGTTAVYVPVMAT